MLTFSVSKVAVLKALELCEVTAKPASTEPLMLNVTLEPATGVQLVPLLEVYAVKVEPERATFKYAGVVPEIAELC